MTLKDCIAGCIKNDPKSQRELYDKLSGLMFSICLRYCKNEGDAADVLQEGFIKVFSKIDQFRNEGDFSAWVRVIMVRTALGHIRNRKILISIDDVQYAEDEYEMQIDFDSYTYEKLLEHIQSMPVGYRTVFNLYVFEEFSHAEIANELNCSESSSRSQLFKARRMMQEKINKDAFFNKNRLQML